MAKQERQPSAAEIRDLIRTDRSKLAVERAKELFKLNHDFSSEELLVEAYQARIDSLLKHNLTLEARALADLVRERHPAFSHILDEVKVRADVRQGNLEDLLRPLADAALAPERRAYIEKILKQEVVRLDRLANCEALPQDHPLRTAASAVWETFQAVTRGPVPPERLALPEVSRNGPLAPWKMMVQAIAALYRKEDEVCRRYLNAIEPGSAAERLRPLMDCLLDGKPSAEMSTGDLPNHLRLINLAGGNRGFLRGLLKQLDSGLEATHGRGNPQKLLPVARQALQACQESTPEFVEELECHLAARLMSADMPRKNLVDLVGAEILLTPGHLRALARGLETSHIEHDALLSCRYWDLFLQTAIESGWFRPGSLECAAVWLHVAAIVERWPKEQVELARAACSSPDPGDDLYCFDCTALYDRAAQADPHADTFRRWYNWERKQGNLQDAEYVAKRWSKELAGDIEPLLELMESTEGRGAFRKSLSFVEKAEQVDGVNPAVRRARFRLLARSAVRSLKDGRPDLAAKHVQSIDALEQARLGDRPLFLEGLRWACGALNGMPGGEPAADLTNRLLRWNIARKCGQTRLCPVPPANGDGQEMSRAAATVSLLGDDVGIPLDIPREWEHGLERALSENEARLEAAQLLSIGEAALRRGVRQVAFAASTAGLSRAGTVEARFLYLRARALPDWAYERRNQCLAAVAELARRSRDTALVAAAVEARQGRNAGGRRGWQPGFPEIERDNLTITPAHLAELLEAERKARGYPESARSTPRYVEKFAVNERCDCPVCRGERGEPVDDGEFPPEMEEIGRELEKILQMKNPNKALGELEALANALGLPLPKVNPSKGKRRGRRGDDWPF